VVFKGTGDRAEKKVKGKTVAKKFVRSEAA